MRTGSPHAGGPAPQQLRATPVVPPPNFARSGDHPLPNLASQYSWTKLMVKEHVPGSHGPRSLARQLPCTPRHASLPACRGRPVRPQGAPLPCRAANADAAKPTRSATLRDGEALKERAVSKHMALLPRKQRLEASSLSQPKQMIAVPRPIAMRRAGVPIDRLTRQEAGGAQTAHDRRRSHGMNCRVRVHS